MNKPRGRRGSLAAEAPTSMAKFSGGRDQSSPGGRTSPISPGAKRSRRKSVVDIAEEKLNHSTNKWRRAGFRKESPLRAKSKLSIWKRYYRKWKRLTGGCASCCSARMENMKMKVVQLSPRPASSPGGERRRRSALTPQLRNLANVRGMSVNLPSLPDVQQKALEKIRAELETAEAGTPLPQFVGTIPKATRTADKWALEQQRTRQRLASGRREHKHKHHTCNIQAADILGLRQSRSAQQLRGEVHEASIWTREMGVNGHSCQWGRKTGYVAQGSVAKLTLGGMAAKFTKDQKFSHSKWQSLHVFLG